MCHTSMLSYFSRAGGYGQGDRCGQVGGCGQAGGYGQGGACGQNRYATIALRFASRLHELSEIESIGA